MKLAFWYTAVNNCTTALEQAQPSSVERGNFVMKLEAENPCTLPLNAVACNSAESPEHEDGQQAGAPQVEVMSAVGWRWRILAFVYGRSKETMALPRWRASRSVAYFLVSFLRGEAATCSSHPNDPACCSKADCGVAVKEAVKEAVKSFLIEEANRLYKQMQYFWARRTRKKEQEGWREEREEWKKQKDEREKEKEGWKAEREEWEKEKKIERCAKAEQDLTTLQAETNSAKWEFAKREAGWEVEKAKWDLERFTYHKETARWELENGKLEKALEAERARGDKAIAEVEELREANLRLEKEKGYLEGERSGLMWIKESWDKHRDCVSAAWLEERKKMSA
ncbi:hypothetical protein BDZ91DRAFT_834975 [Kalaharituber pfeilii]|nr:hypothetical protein BDZ91DRAFT_834975 [Kalaharituber pfeilii]